jgi:hypothetical protein
MRNLLSLCAVVACGLQSVPALAQSLDVQGFGLNRSSNAYGWTRSAAVLDARVELEQCAAIGDLTRVPVTVHIDGAHLQVPVGGFIHYGGGWYSYTSADGSVYLWITVTPMGTAWMHYFTPDLTLVTPEDGVNLSLTINHTTVSSTIHPVADPERISGYDFVFDAGEQGMTCMDVASLKHAENGNMFGWEQTFVGLIGTYGTSSCQQVGHYGPLSARVVVEDFEINVPAGAFKDFGSDYYSYGQRSDERIWWLTVNTRLGIYWVWYWDTVHGLVDTTDGIDVNVSLNEYVGSSLVNVEAFPDNTEYSRSYAYSAPAGSLCGE